MFIGRYDIYTSQGGAENIITKHAISSALFSRSVQVVCDRTDVFALLVHFYDSYGKGSPMIMPSPVELRAVIDIRQTAVGHTHKAEHLLVLPRLSATHTGYR